MAGLDSLVLTSTCPQGERRSGGTLCRRGCLSETTSEEIRVHSMRRSRRRGGRIRQEPHTVRVTVLFSEAQMEIIERYLRRHPGRSRSDFVRRCVMERIVGDATKHRPTLFDDGEGGEEERRW